MSQGSRNVAKNAVQKIGFIVDPDARPDECLKYLLVQFKKKQSELSKLAVPASGPFLSKYYYCLFVMSILAYRRYHWECRRKESGWPKKEPIAFPLTANVGSQKTRCERFAYWFMVTYYYNLMKDYKKHRYVRFHSEPELCKLRDNIISVFEPTKRSCKKIGVEGEKAINLFAKKDKDKEEKKKKLEQIIYFWRKEDFPDYDLNDPGLKQIDILNGPPATSICGEILDRVFDEFCKSDVWKGGEEKAKRKHNTIKSKGKIAKKKPSKKMYRSFKPIKDILKMDVTDNKPEWFRSSGPIAADFRDHRVYINEDNVIALKDYVLNHKISMLQWPSATGKTTLIHSLAYESYEDKSLKFLYFNCDIDREFSSSALVEEIENTKGIFIIENIHLTIRKLRSLIRKLLQLQDLTNRHILFTSRLPIQEKAYLFPDELKKIHFFPRPKSSKKVEPFEDADEIINLFMSRYPEHPLSLEQRKDIKKHTWGSYKWLGYALQGFASEKGKGDPDMWLKARLTFELNHLEYGIEDPPESNKSNLQFPEIVVAISSLYMNEILAAENFLTKKLPFEEEDLNTLVELGEVTSQTSRDGYVLYGLPHLVQAKAYWNYGLEYRRRKSLWKYRKYKDLLYHYAISDVPNGFEAILAAENNVQKQVLALLDASGELAAVIAKTSISLRLVLWIEGIDSSFLDRNDVLLALAHVIEETDNVSYLRSLIDAIYHHGKEIAESLWNCINTSKLKDRIRKSDEPFIFVGTIELVFYKDPARAHKLCRLLSVDKLASDLGHCDEVVIEGGIIYKICSANKHVGRKLWSRINKKSLATRISRAWCAETARKSISAIWHGDPNMGKELCSLLDTEKLAVTLLAERILRDVGEFIHTLHRANKDVAWKLWKDLDKSRLVKRLSRPRFLWDTAACIRAIDEVEPYMAWHLCKRLKIQDLALTWRETDRIDSKERFSRVIREVDEDVFKNLMEVLRE